MGRAWIAAFVLGLVVGVLPVRAQEFAGTVTDAVSGEALEGALVEVVGSRAVTLTDGAGRFAFDLIRSDGDSVRISRLGYSPFLAWVDFDAADAHVFSLDRAPVELRGVTAELGFEGRMEYLEARLDERLGEWPGYARVAGVEDLRAFDGDWKGDPWSFLHYGPLKVSWQWNEAPWEAEDEVYVRAYGTVTPEVWLDDRRIWLQALTATPNESLCRVETYMPKVRPWWAGAGPVEPPPQIRAYTCSFMARVATGQQEMCPVLRWGGFLAGPGGGRQAFQSGAERAVARPAIALPTMDLGPGLDLSARAIGVGSGACRR